MEIIARRLPDKREQSLLQHTLETAELASGFAKELGFSKTAYTLGIYHDAGKATPEFQAYIRDDTAPRGSVQHSIHGAKMFVKDYANLKMINKIFANLIASHHGRLRDFISYDGETPLSDELEENENPIAPPIQAEFTAKELHTEFINALKRMPNQAFGFSMLTKMLYSMLIDADRLGAALFEEGIPVDHYSEPVPDWDGMLSKLEAHLTNISTNKSSFKNADTDITNLRQQISDQCAASGTLPPAIYKLEVPTGGGKTLSSLRFALTHAKTHGMKRIIYVIPYLSILSQTAIDIRNALGIKEKPDDPSPIVLEHHSNILPDNEDYYKLHTDRWDSPIILTTQVQLLESLFSAKGSDLRKLHHMINAVLIFDEIQSLPVKCIHLFNYAMNFLSRFCASTVLLCTATQPLLDKVERKILLSERGSIAKAGVMPARTKLVPLLKAKGYSISELSDFIRDRHNISTLVIVNTKKAAVELYRSLSQFRDDVVHLSTNMCPMNRDDVIGKPSDDAIETLRKKLETKQSVICIATQLIEAGIDISFECVIRDLAGLDSILQAAGRCNRHNEFGQTMPVYIVNIAGENLDKLPDIKEGAEVTRRLIHEGNLDITEFYRLYFYARRTSMDYTTKSRGSIVDLLGENKQGKGVYKNRTGTEPINQMTSAIRSASDEFYIIARGQTEVVVPYKDSKELLAQYEKTTDLKEKRQLLRKLGRYSVSLYRYQIDELVSRGAISESDGVNVLAEGFYDETLGLDISGCHLYLEC